MSDPTIIPVTVVFLILVTLSIIMGLNKVSYIMVLTYLLYIIISWLSGLETKPKAPPIPKENIIIPVPQTSDSDSVVTTETTIPEKPSVDNPETISEPVKPEKYEYYIPIRLNNLLMTRGIDYRDPIDTLTAFNDSTDFIYCFTAVENQNPYTVPIYHEWRYEGVYFSKVKITVGKSYNWRCWSRVSNAGEWTGDWQVIISDSLGARLDSIQFKVLPRQNNDLIRVP